MIDRTNPDTYTPPQAFTNTGVAGGKPKVVTPPIGRSSPLSMGSYFSDPVLQSHLNFGTGAISKLMQPQTINPILQQAIDALTHASSAGPAHLNTEFYDTFKNTVQKRQAELAQPGYSQSQQDLLRTNVSDPLEAQKSAARQQVIEHFASQGMSPSSGIVQQALLDSDRKFSEMRTTGERQLATTEIAQDEARKNQAVDIGSILAQLGLSGSTAQLGADTAGRGQNLQAAGALAGIGGDLQQEPIQRLMQAFGISQGLSQMPYQSLNAAQGAMNSVNGQQVPQADNNAQLIQLLLGLSQQGENTFQDSQANGNSFWSMLGSSMPGLLGSFAKLFGQGGNGPAGAPPVGGGGGYG